MTYDKWGTQRVLVTLVTWIMQVIQTAYVVPGDECWVHAFQTRSSCQDVQWDFIRDADTLSTW